MTNDRDTPNGPFPASPPQPGGDESWKTQRTDCWPTLTPERVAEHKRMMTPLDAVADSPDDADDADDPDEDPGSEEVADDEGMALPPSDDPGGDEGGPQVPDGDVAAISDDAPDRFTDSLRRLDGLDGRPVGEHAEAFDAVHRDLRQSLDDIER